MFSIGALLSTYKLLRAVDLSKPLIEVSLHPQLGELPFEHIDIPIGENHERNH